MVHGGVRYLQQGNVKLVLEALKERISYRRTLERVWVFVEETYRDSDLSLALVARHGGISQNHLNVLMNRETGFSFHELLSRYRLFQAGRMMMSKDYTFLEIAYGRILYKYSRAIKEFQSRIAFFKPAVFNL